MSVYDRWPYLCGVTGPEQPVGIGADCPEDWNRQPGEGSDGNVTRTERVNQEIVLDLIYVPRVRLVYRGKSNTHEIAQEIHLPTGQADLTEFFRYVVSPGRGFSKLAADGGKGRSPVCCIVVLSLSFQLCVRHVQVIDIIPLMRKGSLTSSAEQLVRFPVEASLFRPDCILGPLDNSHEFSKHQGRIWVANCHDRSCVSQHFSPKAWFKVCGR